MEAHQTVGYSSYISEQFHSGERGRPIFHIGKEQLEYFLQHGFTGPDIAAMLGVSLRTVRRRISNFGLSIRGLYSNLSDVELDPLVTEICSAFPDIGYRRLLGELERRNIRISRTRARESLRRVDPLGVMSRWVRGPVTRREYHVPGPLSLWHIDGNHKLIRLGMCSYMYMLVLYCT